jgi:hypothetical protein
MTVTQIWLLGATIEAKITSEVKNTSEVKILGHCRRDDHRDGLAEYTSEAEPMPWAVPKDPRPQKTKPWRMLRFGTSLFYVHQMTIG